MNAKTIRKVTSVVIGSLALAGVPTGAAAVETGGRIVYVAPDGAGDGTSWESPLGDVSSAYAQAAEGATLDAPGEVRMKGGLYTLTGAIEMKPNVTIVGGYDGETVLSGDKGRNNYWNEKGNLIYKDGVWGSLTAQANPTDPDKNKAATCDITYCFSNGVDVAAQNCTFKKLTFTGFGLSAIYSTSGLADGLTLDECQFKGVGTGLSDGNSRPVSVANSRTVLKNCTFIGNYYGAYLYGSDREVVHHVEKCVFRYNHGDYTSAPCLHFAGKAAVDAISGCVFEGNFQQATTVNGRPASALTLYMNETEELLTTVVTNCDFIGNMARNYCHGSVNVQVGSGRSVYFRNCRFLKNVHAAATKYANGVGAAVGMQDGEATFESCYFGENVATNSYAGDTTRAEGAVIGIYKGAASFYNCTMEKNEAIGTITESETALAMGICASGWQAGLAFGNCLFADNEVRYLDKAGADICFAGHFQAEFSLVNTVMTAASDDYLPVWLGSPASNTYVYYNKLAAKNADKMQPLTESKQAYIRDVYTVTDALKLRNALVGPEGVVARGLAWNSDYRKAGTHVVRDGANGIYYYDQVKNQFKKLGTLGFNTAVTLSDPPDADAFRAPRKADRIALGPLNAQTPGLVICFQ